MIINQFTPLFSLPLITSTTTDQSFDISSQKEVKESVGVGCVVRCCCDPANTDVVWIRLGMQSSTNVIPTTGRENSMPLLPGAIELFSFNDAICWLHVISLAAGQKLYVTVGNGS